MAFTVFFFTTENLSKGSRFTKKLIASSSFREPLVSQLLRDDDEDILTNFYFIYAPARHEMHSGEFLFITESALDVILFDLKRRLFKEVFRRQFVPKMVVKMF